MCIQCAFCALKQPVNKTIHYTLIKVNFVKHCPLKFLVNVHTTRSHMFLPVFTQRYQTAHVLWDFNFYWSTFIRISLKTIFQTVCTNLTNWVLQRIAVIGFVYL